MHQRVNRLALITNHDSRWNAYDCEGKLWGYRWERSSKRHSIVSRLLAHTIYDPCCMVAVSWTPIRDYRFDELRRLYLDAIADDDDILTQFVDGEELIERVSACVQFDELLKVWEWMETDSLAAE